ncbi:MAG: aminoglycoside phosphotransferase [Tardiphaga sp.]|nr:aminoglycoside phosphotransferase [Tardiphaga sp.]
MDSNGPDTSGIARFLRDAGLIAPGEHAVFTPLTGGVASDIWKVEAGGRTIAVKRALQKLRVARDWTVPTSRNASEVDWMRAAYDIASSAVPRILAHDPALGAFAMDYLDPAGHPVWKAELAAGRADPAFAARVGATIGAIHAATAHDEAIAKRFANDALFHAIRLEPYLEATADAHPALVAKLMALSRETLAQKIALVHGDVSPKNILVGPNGPVFLDAECAWYGDPAFDLAFCLNHMLLKCVWRPCAAARFLACFDALSAAYRACIDWEDPDRLEARAAALLPGLLLGRIDGKSPVEYITEDHDKARVRLIACHFLDETPARLSDIRTAWAREFVI